MEKARLYRGSLVATTVRSQFSWKSSFRGVFKSFMMTKLLLLLTAACLQAGIDGHSQRISLSLKNVSLEKVFLEIEKQTSYHFIYTREEIENTGKVSIEVRDIDLAKTLDICFRELPLSYTLDDSYIIIKRKEAINSIPVIPEKNTVISGKVTNEKGEPVVGATVTVKGTSVATATNERGEFSIEYNGTISTLLVSSIGYSSREIAVSGRNAIEITLQIAISTLDESIVMAYGNTTRRLNTGNIGKVDAAEIERQPVGNPLATLHGRVPGVTVTQVSGIPGSAVKIQIRGRTSINNSINNDPFFIIDGVPYAANNDKISQASSALSSTGMSPFSIINPADIESIEVLKDADATAIYGSRAANGVILITTKKGKPGKTKIDANVYTGFSKVTRTMDMLNTRQYIEMRKEAFANDGIIPNAVAGSTGYAPDLMIWDTTRYTDFKQLLIGGTAHTTDAQVSISGGNTNTQFLLGTGYHRETTVYPGGLANKRGSFHINLNHNSTNRKFSLSLTASYIFSDNNINVADLNTLINLPPNLPSLYDSSGKLNWQQGGATFSNPLAPVLRKYNGKTANLVSNLLLSFQILKGFTFRTNMGYNSMDLEDMSITPISSLSPSGNPTGTANFGTNHLKSIIIEPQIEFIRNIGKLRLESLVGATWQQNNSENSLISGTGYTNDALLGSISGAVSVNISGADSRYRYAALFGRLNLNLQDKYILNISGRRDGSSRFGPGKQFANFGAIGMAWIFSREKFIHNSLSFISFGKLRASLGTTGNDKIGNYGYLDTYSSTGLVYQGVSGIFPTTLFNPDFAWELNRKMEGALELGILQDRILLNTSYYRNRTGNQLINYALPSQTGGSSIIGNFPATVINSGWEFELKTVNVKTKNFEWSNYLNLTIPKDKLASFPGIETSSYSNLVVGESLNIFGGYRFAGVNTQTGIFEFVDKNGSPTSAPVTADKQKNLGNFDPEFFGGFRNSFQYKNWELDIFFEFKKQTGKRYAATVFSALTYPGTMFNQPLLVMDRWRGPGDITEVQKFSTRSGTPAFNAANVLRISGSDYMNGNTSYARLKNLSFSYRFPDILMKNIHAEGGKVYIEGQNLLTITGYKGSDPESQELYRLPPLRIFAVGLQFTF
ncbi:MAG TPA: SusC/RagA family TonB-linked outer membrane protein [Chitinophagaceae bacterium]|nr:SusC/RagA family TonB-linked outer membrane protein [Chitinophagaceae bacterium]